MTETISTTELDEMRRQSGLDLMGVAETDAVKDQVCSLPGDIIGRLPFAIVGAVRVSSAVLDTLEDGPNTIYYHHYRQLNFHLDRAALRVSREIENKGYLALPIAASQVVDWEKMRGHVSHKDLGHLAGLGWLGRHNLLVTPEYGAQVRLVSILTNMPLSPGRPAADGCGECRSCLAVCPAGAIRESPGEFDHLACYQQLKDFGKSRRIGQYICGLCVKACSGPIARIGMTGGENGSAPDS
jgi:epoxyqueuosine reductase